MGTGGWLCGNVRRVESRNKKVLDITNILWDMLYAIECWFNIDTPNNADLNTISYHPTLIHHF